MRGILIIYSAVSLILAALTLLYGIKALKKKTLLGKFLGLTILMATVTIASYTLSVVCSGYRTAAFFAGIYFCSIDGVLICMLAYISELIGMYSGQEGDAMKDRLFRLFHLYMLFDILIQMINPFREISIHYVERPGAVIAHYSYDMKFLYQMHLAFCYCIVAVIVYRLIRKWRSTPREYRVNLTVHLNIFALIILLNAGFLFIKGNALLQNLDISTWLYPIAVLLYYIFTFRYYPRILQNSLRSRVVESVSQGIILFDYEDRLIMWNERARKLLPVAEMREGIPFSSFTDNAGIPLREETGDAEISFQFYQQAENKPHPLRCDYCPQKNEQGTKLGTLLVLTDAILESDLLTGFHSWDSFLQLVHENPEHYNYPAVVVMADISDMTEINNTLGRAAGDQLMVELSAALRNAFQPDAYFVRGLDGRLLTIRRGTDEAEARKLTQSVRKEFSGHFVFSVVRTDRYKPDILKAIAEAEQSLRTRKLMDSNSRHSEVLNSLMKTMQECDPDTQAHVERTQKLGYELGRRLGLSDAAQADLALLCILHDIGKIGIPLEILNKPGKLNDAEYRIMQEHVLKGAQIAASSEGLAGVADMVLHHHERWDGEGYPDGLSKESIPLLSRVIAVVDSYDAMVSDRVYRPALTREEAMEELRRCAGTQFDPGIVAEFLQMLKETDMGQQFKKDKPVPAEEIMIRRSRKSEPAQNGIAVHLVHYGRYTLDPDMKIISVSDAFEELTGYTREDIAKGNLTQMDLLPEEDRTEYLTLITAMLARTELIYCEHRLRRKDGSLLYVFCSGRVYYSAGARENRSDIIIADASATEIIRDMSRQLKAGAEGRINRWEEKYRCDSLTGLMTKEALRSDTEERLLQERFRVLMIMMDLDHFKEYNDSFGHPAGDVYLKLAAASIREAIGEQNFAGRIGGDEFAAVLFFAETTTNEEMEQRGRILYEEIAAALARDPNNGGLSMGTACSGEGLDTFNELYLAADNALYESKQQGRGRISHYRKG